MKKFNMRIKHIRWLAPSFILMYLLSLILPFRSAEGLSILSNTTSHLGAQHTPNAWIMNMGFVLTGIGCMLEAKLHLIRYPFHMVLLILFGCGLVSVAIFSHAPIVNTVDYHVLEDRMHSFFASSVGLIFTIFAFSTIFIEKRMRDKVIALWVAGAAIGFSFLMFQLPELAGLWQRLMFAVSFIWLIIFLERTKTNLEKV